MIEHNAEYIAFLKEEYKKPELKPLVTFEQPKNVISFCKTQWNMKFDSEQDAQSFFDENNGKFCFYGEWRKLVFNTF